jgi:hypothetical protein
MKFNPENHVVGKVYDLTQENMNAMLIHIETLEEENEYLHAMLTCIKQSLIEISIQSEGTVMAIDEIKTNKVL